jgi:Leucine-rich repeat (LRR) protein
MGLTELPSELFRMTNVKTLWLHNNDLCSLPSEIAHLTTLVNLFVRLLKRLHRDLTKPRCFSGRRQPAQVSSARARSADQSQGALCAALEADGSLISPCVTCFQVHNNLLTSLPVEIGQLRQLEALLVRDSN